MARTLFLLLAVAALGACSGDDGDTADSGTAGETGDTGTATYDVSGNVIDFIARTPVADIQVCADPAMGVECTTTDADGNYTLTGVPGGYEGAAVFTGEGFMNSRFYGTTLPDENSTLNASILSMDGATLLATTSGTELDPTMGHISSGIIYDGSGNGLAGVTLELSPSAGFGPVYLGESGLPDPELAGTSATGVAGFLNVPPGEYEITATAEGLTCTAGTGSTPGITGTIRIGVVANEASAPAGGIRCE